MTRHAPPAVSGIAPLLTYVQAAKILGVTDKTIRNYVKSGLLPAVRFAGNVRIVESDLAAFIERCKQTGPQEASQGDGAAA